LLYNLPTPLSGFFLQNELATQFHLQPKEFFCLTNAGIHVLAQLRPVDYLRQLISDSGGQTTQQLKNFFARYSKDEACAMCLALAAQIGSNPSLI
jgi:nuclear pore complex protein Nup155